MSVLAFARRILSGEGRAAFACSDDVGSTPVAETDDFRFGDVSDVAPVMLWTADAAGRAQVNAEFRRFWGDRPLSFDDVTPWLEVVHPDDRDRVFAAALTALEAQGPLTIEARYRRADGEWRTLSTRAEPRFASDGAFAGMVGANTDVTETRAAQAALAQSEAELRAMVAQAAAGIVRCDLEGRVVSANARFGEMLGRPTEAIVGRHVADFTHPDDISETHLAIVETQAVVEERQFAKRYLKPDGAVTWALLNVRTLRHADGAAYGFMTVALDTTPQHAAEDELRESEERFRRMADTAPSPVWLTDEDGAVEFVNQALVDFYGHPAEDILGHVWKQAVHPDDVAAVAEAQAEHRPARRPYGFECRFQRADGVWRWLRVSVNPRFDGTGAFRGYVGLSFDVTETHEALDALAAQERRQGLLLDLTDRLRDLTDAEAVIDEVARTLGESLDVDRVGYGEIDEELQQATVQNVWTRGDLPDVRGTWRMDDFGPALADELRRGVVTRVSDVAVDPRTAETAQASRSLDIRACVTVPLMRAGRLRAVLFVHSTRPRDWTDAESDLLYDVAERAFGEIARARAQTELVESEHRFRAVADTAPVLIWVTGTDGARAFVNQAYVEYMGGDYETVRTADWRAFIHPDDQDRVKAESLAGEASGGPFSLEARYLRGDGGYRWLNSLSRPRKGPGGEGLGFVGVAFDVTDIRRTAGRLADAAAERDAILGQLAEGVIVTDPEGRIVFVNDAATRHHGVARLDVPPENYSEAYHLFTDDGAPYPPEDLPLARAVMKGETVTDARWRIRRPDGTEIIALGNARPVTGPDGTPMGAVLTLRDETARIDAEHRLSESEARFRTVADSVPALIWMTDELGQFVFTNKRFETFFGLADNASGDGWRRIAYPDDIDLFDAAFMRALAARDRFEAMKRVVHPVMGLRWLRCEGLPRFDGAGVFQGYVGANIDVTEARQAEDGLKRINELLEERVGEALAEKARAEADLMHAQRMEAVGRLTGGVAHDFNNLLTVVIGALDMMLRSPDDAARRKKLGEAALAAARRGESLTHQLLAFSRRQALRPVPVDLNALIREGEPLLRRAVGEAVEFRLKLRRGGARVNVDPAQFEAALLNLIVNARDAVGGGAGRIAVQTMSCKVEPGEVVDLAFGDYVCVTVSDNGAGMDATTMTRVFEPFFTTKAVGKGTGLGLSQVYGFARQSGGGVHISSTVGRGTEIRLYLPPLPKTERVATVPARRDLEPLSSGRRLLLVEDDLGVSAVAVELLEGMGLEVVAVETGPEALETLAEGRFDVMLSDVVMPGGMTGIELARAVAPLHPDLRIILTSGYAGDDVDEALADAPWPFLRKPYSRDQLSDALAALLPVDG